MIAYDHKFYYDRSKEPFSDPEWDEASAADEPEVYWWIVRNPRIPSRRIIKRYKPSVAKLMCERTGWYAERV